MQHAFIEEVSLNEFQSDYDFLSAQPWFVPADRKTRSAGSAQFFPAAFPNKTYPARRHPIR